MLRRGAMRAFTASMLELITKTSTTLPADVRRAIAAALEQEEPGTRAAQALAVIATNVDMACEAEGPICQDTGMPTFEVKVPVGINQIILRRQIEEAVAEATRLGNYGRTP
jgi:fumarate hydratase class I